MSIYPQIDLTRIRTGSIHDRRSRMQLRQSARPPRAGMSMRDFLNGLPALLKADDLKSVAAAVVAARQRDKPVLVLMGGHVIKTGCGPVVADLVENGLVTHVASPGAAAVHDVELALCGHTSEDVAQRLAQGRFGMDRETADVFQAAGRRAVELREGLGEALGSVLLETRPAHPAASLLAHCRRRRVPFTLHVALGTDIVHQHPGIDGAALGEASLRDFRILAAAMTGLNGGVVLNFGSAVIMPEVFLKALALVRNSGHDVAAFTAADFDMIQHYRPGRNIVERPVAAGGRGFRLTGHHEIMLPLLAAAVYEQLHP